ncbi:hypothetical protein ACFORH_43260 [Amycolatopsis roodepoortensis]|uniref:Uncharacterized protein n=1 Tax=Amycolatopsis roodepoortensis TaxID=700274 RepID=A0ABR9LJQ5_9PSEU|nr:hypothetical protein [Amycolatopsis roodepoortensis]MBE1580438.1 hypothetical protein [Amycolatopsis roodepoortensis]
MFVAVLISYATHVALSRPDKQHRADAFRVLKLIWGTATSAGGIAAIAIRLHDFGLL